MTDRKDHTVVTVPLGDRSYPIHIGTDLLRRAGALIAEQCRSRAAVIVTDTAVAPLCLDAVRAGMVRSGFSVLSIVIPRGERQKNPARASWIHAQMAERTLGRSTVVVALGGGVIGDLAGFVAATYMRGIEFVQVPTTLLAQVDSSVGGKVGVNLPQAKNLVGAFHQPTCVIADIGTLSTLPRRELVCGLGEVVKYGVILDRTFFSFVTGAVPQALRRDPEVLAAMVRRSCQLKAQVVSKDERESGLRAILNFGHTVGHALEKAGGYSRLKHGEAVLYGMLAETFIARNAGMLSPRHAAAVIDAVRLVPLPSLSRIAMNDRLLLTAMRSDKKSAAGAIRMVLPRRIGSVTLPRTVTPAAIVRALNELRRYDR
ncbi:MAG: 3-dehydroquinate synthase [Bacteroidetes bacterium]|nr:MAG: 3-dehydroquinate synthase [Bacteroidota bacterium]